MLCEKEKAPAGAGTPTRAAGDGLPTMYPTKNFTTSAGKTLHISDLLHPGAENGVKLTELAALTNQDENCAAADSSRAQGGQADSVGLPARIFLASVRAGSAAVYSLHERAGLRDRCYQPRGRSGTCGYGWARADRGVERWLNEECFPLTLWIQIRFSIYHEFLNPCTSTSVCGQTTMVLYRLQSGSRRW